jgi:hypothetical protein
VLAGAFGSIIPYIESGGSRPSPGGLDIPVSLIRRRSGQSLGPGPFADGTIPWPSNHVCHSAQRVPVDFKVKCPSQVPANSPAIAYGNPTAKTVSRQSPTFIQEPPLADSTPSLKNARRRTAR